MVRVFSSYWSATSASPCLSPFGIRPFLALMTVSLYDTKTTLSNGDIQAPDDRGVCQLLNVYIIMSSWVPPLLRESSRV
jgi:hypothetical protein